VIKELTFVQIQAVPVPDSQEDDPMFNADANGDTVVYKSMTWL